MSNILINNINSFKDMLKDKKILIFGPANDNNNLSKSFDKYDIIILFGTYLQILIDKEIDISKYKIVLLCSGWFTKAFKDLITENEKNIFYFLGSEVDTFNVLASYGIEKNKIISMNMNYINYNFDGCPTMGVKIIMFLLNYNIIFKKIKISGLTFYMDFNNNKCIYNLEYKNIAYNRLYKDISTFQLSKEDLEKYKGYSYENLPEHLKIKGLNNRIIPNKTHKTIYQGWNIFLYFLNKFKNYKIILDKKLTKLLKDNPNIKNTEIDF